VQPVFLARYSEPSAKLRFLICQLKGVCTPPPPNFVQTIQYKGVTCIIYKTKDLAPRSQPWIGLLLTRSRTEALTIVAHG